MRKKTNKTLRLGYAVRILTPDGDFVTECASIKAPKDYRVVGLEEYEGITGEELFKKFYPIESEASGITKGD